VSGLATKGAAGLVGVLFSAGFVAALGSAIQWTRFDSAGLPADQAVAALPREEVMVVLLAYLVDTSGSRSTATRSVLVCAAVAGCVACAIVTEIGVWGIVGLAILSLALVALNLGVAERTKHFVWFGTCLFVSVALFGGVAAYLHNSADPQVQPVALLRGPDDNGLTGLYVARNDHRVYLGRPNEDAVYVFPCKVVTSLAVGGLQGLHRAQEQRFVLLDALREARKLEGSASSAAKTEATAPTAIC
jgi:hypothetical protein